MKLVSVIMPVYNEEGCVAKAIESILNQSYSCFEFIIINDGSLDKSQDIINYYASIDKRIKLIQKENSGVADSLNIGIANSNGEYIARMDADDESHRERLFIQVRYLEQHTEIAMVGSWCYIKRQDKVLKFCPPTKNSEIRKYMAKDNPFVHGSMMIRKSVLASCGYYSNIKGMEDYDLWVRIAKHHKVSNIPLFLITRNDSNNFETKQTWANIKLYNIYRMRLKYQLRAIKLQKFKPCFIWYLAKTIMSMLIAKTK